MVTAVVAAILAFVSTNIDDVLILLVLFSQGRRPRSVVAGQYLGFGGLVLCSLLISAGALLLPREWVGILGAAPLAIGIKGLASLRSREAAAGERKRVGMGVLPVAAVTLANGGDNIAVYVPLFARRPWSELLAVVMVFGVLLAVMCAAGYALVRLPVVSALLDRWGHWIAPVVLVGLGVYVFVEAGTAAYVLRLLTSS